VVSVYVVAGEVAGATMVTTAMGVPFSPPEVVLRRML
jgi:hypothetical protein